MQGRLLHELHWGRHATRRDDGVGTPPIRGPMAQLPIKCGGLNTWAARGGLRGCRRPGDAGSDAWVDGAGHWGRRLGYEASHMKTTAEVPALCCSPMCNPGHRPCMGDRAARSSRQWGRRGRATAQLPELISPYLYRICKFFRYVPKQRIK
jgi:hypothetical protein